MLQQRDINKIQAILFMQRLYAYLLVVRYVQLLAKFHSEDKEQDNQDNNAENFTYDSAGRLTTLLTRNSQLETLDSYTYTHDNIGNRLTMATPNNTATYTYDKIYRLLSSTYSNSGPTKLQNDVYTYDPVGNRLTSSPNRAYTYNTANQLINYKGKAYIYDKNGNLLIKTDEDYDLDTEIEGWTYTYDYENRLIKITKNEKNESKTITFKYDPFGRRIEKKITENNSTATTKYVYDNEDIILEYDENRIIGNSYIHGPGIDEPLAVTTNQGTYYYHADGLGSIVALTDTNGKTQQTYEYDSFGNLKDQKNKIKQPYTYTGREWDREAGLYYYRTRYYDPKNGRFVSKDRFRGFLINPKTQHRYSYVGNSPINFIDPLGLLECRPWKLPPNIPLLPDQLKQPKFDIPYTEWWPGTLSPWVDPKGLPTEDWLLPPNDASKSKNEPIWGLKWEWNF